MADKSFFHDAWRTDYQPQTDAEWLWAYFVTRRSQRHEGKILATASSIVERLNAEFKAYPHIPSQVTLTIYDVGDVLQVPADVDLGLVPIFVAKILRDQGSVAMIVSSVKTEKWLERLKWAGLNWKVEGFTKEMSDDRAMEQAWFVPVGTHMASHYLEGLDPAYKEVVKAIGSPAR